MAITARAGQLVIIGLEEKNIEKLKAGQPFHHHMNEIGLPFQVMIFYAPSLEDLKTTMQEFVGEHTQVVDNTTRKTN